MSDLESVPPENPLSTDQTGPDALPPPEIEVVNHWKVSCQGDVSRGLGHPRVWLMISPETGYVDCGYCDKRFVIDRDHLARDH